MKTPNFATGDKVAYSVQFIRSIGEPPTSDICHARGTIIGFKEYGSLRLATIQWDNPEMPDTVNCFNLAKAGPNSRFCAC